jgi:hypothetical protein
MDVKSLPAAFLTRLQVKTTCYTLEGQTLLLDTILGD